MTPTQADNIRKIFAEYGERAIEAIDCEVSPENRAYIANLHTALGPLHGDMILTASKIHRRPKLSLVK